MGTKTNLSARDRIEIGVLISGALLFVAILAAMLETLFASGGHAGSDMARLARSMDLRSGASLLLWCAGAAAFYGCVQRPHRVLAFALAGLVLWIASAAIIAGVFLDLDALESASSCGISDLCY
ncbi:MAG TPA: hypothetical protein VNU25_03450 [Candidatus Paceibacterota bacterium]|nr:hypothetical protein [Candidatus Paceibacterota bacterium]